MKLWLEVTQDRYELPIIVCDSSEELASYVGTTSINIRSQVAKYNAGVVKTCRYRMVPFDVKLDEVV